MISFMDFWYNVQKVEDEDCGIDDEEEEDVNPLSL